MSFATEMLATAQTAYKNALSAQFTQFNGRRWQSHEIDKMLAQVNHWQGVVDRETAAANGGASYGRPFRFNL